LVKNSHFAQLVPETSGGAIWRTTMKQNVRITAAAVVLETNELCPSVVIA